MNTTTAINTTALTAAAKAWVIASNARKVAFEAFDAAQSLSKRSKSRDLLIAATKPAYDAATAADEAAYREFAAVKADAIVALEVALLDKACDDAAQRATVRLGVDYCRVASLNAIAAGFRKSVEQKDWKALRNIDLSVAAQHGAFDHVSVTIETNHNGGIRQFEVGIPLTRTRHDGSRHVSTFSVTTVDGEGFNLTSTRIGNDEVPANAFARAWSAAESLREVIAALGSAEARAAYEAIEKAASDALDAAEASLALEQGNAENAARHDANEAAAQ